MIESFKNKALDKPIRPVHPGEDELTANFAPVIKLNRSIDTV